MRNGVDDGLAHSLRGGTSYVAGAVGPPGPGADRTGNLGEYEVKRLIDQFKDSALVNLVGGNGFTHLDAVEMKALDLGAGEETLWLFSEQEHGRVVGGETPVKQVQVRQRLAHRGGIGGAEGIPSTLLSPGKKLPDLLLRDIVERSINTCGGIKRAGSQRAGAVQVFDKAGINLRRQLRNAAETAADELAVNVAEKSKHLRVAHRVIVAFDEDQAFFTAGSGTIKLPLGGRATVGIRTTVLVAKQAEVDAAAVHLCQIGLVRPAPGSRQVFEEEYIVKTMQQGGSRLM